MSLVSLYTLTPLIAQAPIGPEQAPIAKPILAMIALLALALAPFLLMMTTSFVKISVVFSLIRTALGTQQIPPNTVINGLALILTVYIMVPVGQEIYAEVEDEIRAQTQEDQPLFSTASAETIKKVIDRGKEPVRGFLQKHASPQNLDLFFSVAKKLRRGNDADIDRTDFTILLPAFIITELSEAFQIGFVIFLPFLVVDMVVSNILLSMGMFMVSPVTVALPFKLLLFVLVDGWSLITKGLITGYIK
jgi:type III secretion protein R